MDVRAVKAPAIQRCRRSRKSVSTLLSQFSRSMGLINARTPCGLFTEDSAPVCSASVTAAARDSRALERRRSRNVSGVLLLPLVVSNDTNWSTRVRRT
jgi:hypothetical protein